MESTAKNKDNKISRLAIIKGNEDLERLVKKKSSSILFGTFKWLVLIGVAYIILSPLINIVASSFFSASDMYNPAVFLIPMEATLDAYRSALVRMDYWSTLSQTAIHTFALTLIQVFITSMVGYGFARFDFPFKKTLFAFVILTIVIPPNTIMIPLYMLFRNFNPLGLFSVFANGSQNWLGTTRPIYLLTLFGSGLRSGLFIYIFNQFFRGLPKEIEEAAFMDGAGAFYTYFRVMIPNAIPSIVTVTVFSAVWQYNDTFYPRLFAISSGSLMSMRISTLQATIANLDEIKDPVIQQIYLHAGIVLVLIPVVIFYVILQRQFIEGIERSGIVG